MEIKKFMNINDFIKTQSQEIIDLYDQILVLATLLDYFLDITHKNGGTELDYFIIKIIRPSAIDPKKINMYNVEGSAFITICVCRGKFQFVDANIDSINTYDKKGLKKVFRKALKML